MVGPPNFSRDQSVSAQKMSSGLAALRLIFLIKLINPLRRRCCSALRMNEDSVVQQQQQQQQQEQEQQGAVPPTIAYMDGKAIGNRSGIMNSFMGCFGFLPIIGKSKPEGLENHQGKSKFVKSAQFNAIPDSSGRFFGSKYSRYKRFIWERVTVRFQRPVM